MVATVVAYQLKELPKPNSTIGLTVQMCHPVYVTGLMVLLRCAMSVLQSHVSSRSCLAWRGAPLRIKLRFGAGSGYVVEGGRAEIERCIRRSPLPSPPAVSAATAFAPYFPL